jgi:hypothetical protein
VELLTIVAHDTPGAGRSVELPPVRLASLTASREAVDPRGVDRSGVVPRSRDDEMIKTRLSGDKVLVVFELPEEVEAESVGLCGEFNEWSPTAHPLSRTEGGPFRVSVELAAGRRWRFRYLLDGGRWENDWAADDYVPNMHGGDDSVVDLTDTSELPVAPTEPLPAVHGSHGESSEAGADSSGAVATTAVEPPPAAGKTTASMTTAKKTAKKTTSAAKAASAATAAPAKKTTPVKKATAAKATPAKKTPTASTEQGAEVEKPKRGRKRSTPEG